MACLKYLKYGLLMGIFWAFNSNAQVVIESGLPIAIDSGLTVSVQGKLEAASSFANDGVLILDDTIKMTNYSGSGSVIALGANQHFYFNGSTVANMTATGGLKTLHADLILGNLILSSAQIAVDTNRLQITSSISGYDSLNYINGRLIRSGADSLVFPIGNGAIYTPVVLSSIVGTSPAISVEYMVGSPSATAGYGLLDVSNQHYWRVSEASGTLTSAKVQLPTMDESVVASISEATVAFGQSTGVRFRGLGQGIITGTITEGSILAHDSSGAGIYAIGKYFDELLRKNDSLALVSIYDATNGQSWNGNTGWKSLNLDQWLRLTLQDKRVVGVNLSSNNLVGEIGDITSGLELLTDLDLSANEITSIGDITSLSALQTLNISGNRLQFASLEPLVLLAPTVSYGPQKEVLEKIRVLEAIGNSYTVDRTVSGSANTYTWEKNGNSISQTSSAFDVTIEDFTADGNYVAYVENFNVPGLILTTTPVQLRVSSIERDSASLIALYDSLNGSASTLASWPTLPIDQWPEVTISNSRVTSLELSSKGLNGAIPEDILDIQSLVSADFSDNNINGLPILVGSLPNVTAFNAAGNKLSFEDLEPNVEFAPLNYSNQQRFGQVYYDTLHIGTVVDLSQLVGGRFNQYQWYYTDHNTTDQLISGLDSATFVIDSLNFNNMGRYELKVINDSVPNLILSSEYQTILASADLNFTALDLEGDPFIAGEAYALQIAAPGEPYDTTRTVQGEGSGFDFKDLVLGNYLIAVAPNDLQEFLPTYYSNTDLWTEADTLLLRYDREDTLLMAQIPPDPGTEGAVVSGTILGEEIPDGRIDARRKVKRAGCSVRRFVPKGRTDQDEEGEYELYAYVQSDDEGYFEFTGLIDGKYRFNIEYPGIPMDTSSYVEFTIGEGGIEDEELVLEATLTDEGNIFVKKIDRLGFYRKYFKDLKIYPNPADHEVYISYSKLMSSSVIVRLIDLQGNVMREQLIEKGFDKELEFDVSSISGGVYILNFIDTSLGAEMITSYKVFVKH